VTRSKNFSHVELWPYVYLGRKLVPATRWQLVHLLWDSGPVMGKQILKY